MPVLATCPRCTRTLRVADELTGQPVRCPSCDTIFTTTPLPDGDAPIPVEPLPEPEHAPAVRRPSHELEPCPSCGQRVSADEPRCPSCGAELEWEDEVPRPWERHGRFRRDTEPHRAGLILTLGIISIVLAPLSFCCSFFGVVIEVIGGAMGITAWVLGRGDLAKMKARSMDPRGYGNTHAGVVCGIIGTILSGLGFLVLMLYIAFIGTLMFRMTPGPMLVAPAAPVATVNSGPLQADEPGKPGAGARELLPPPREVP